MDTATVEMEAIEVAIITTIVITIKTTRIHKNPMKITTVIQSPKSSSSQTSKKLNKNNKSYDKLLFIQ